MNLARYFIWIGLVLFWFIIIQVLQIPLRKRDGVAVRVSSIAIKIFLYLLTAYLLMVVQSPIMIKPTLHVAALYVALFGDLLGDIFAWIAEAIKKGRLSGKARTVISLICTLVYFLYGTINMQVVTGNEFTITSPKIKGDYRVIFVADMHVGSSQSMATTEKTIGKIRAENPDLILLGGDIVDVHTTKEEMRRTFALLGEIDAPCYFIYGNHDRATDYKEYLDVEFTPEELEEEITSNGITILRDEWIAFSKDLVLMGREDYSMPERKEIEAIEPRPSDAFVLLVDHSPYQSDDIKASKADLQLSGHSHAGQLFPLKWIYRLAGYDSYGFFHHGDTELYVSSGASGWYFPFRSEEGCHYEVVTIKGEG